MRREGGCVVKTVYRVAVGLAWLVATLTVGAAAATGTTSLWWVADTGSAVGQGGDRAVDGPITQDPLGLYAAYMDRGASIDRSRSEHSDAGGIVGLLANHELAVTVALAFAWVAIGVWAINRGSGSEHAGRRPD